TAPAQRADRPEALRVLAIAHKVAGRWPVELSQRFDVDVTTVYCYSPSALGAPVTQTFFVQRTGDIEARILQAMNEPIDVVVSDLPLAVLGEAVTARLAELIAHGVGYVGPLDGLDRAAWRQREDAQASLVRAAVPVPGLRLLRATYGTADKAAREIVACWEGPTGQRAADVSAYPRDTDRPDAARLQYAWLPDMEQEAWCALLGRTVYWAAHRIEGGSSLCGVWADQTIARTALPVKRLDGLRRGSAYAIRIWDADGRLVHEGRNPGLPRLACGRYFLGIQRIEGDGVADWSLTTFEVESPVRIAAIDLDSVDKEPGDSVRAQVRLSAPPPKGARLIFEIIDNYGRCVSKTEKEAAQEAAFEADTAESLHLYNYANVRLLERDGSLLDESRAPFLIAQPLPPADDLSCMVWEGGASFNPRVRPLLKRFAELGVESALQGAYRGSTDTTAVEACAMSNIHPVLYVTALRAEGVDEAGVRRPCITDPRHMNPLKEALRKQAGVFKRFAPLSYSLGDDQHYLRAGQDACWSPTCRAAFAAWAEKKYGDIESINAAWGTAYPGLDAVEPVKRADALAAAQQAPGAEYGPLCHWIDHQIFLDGLIVDWHRTLSDAVQSADPGAVAWYDCTIEGWMRPGSAFDFWQLAANTRFCVQYPNPMVHDVFRAATPPGGYHGTWYGGYGIYNIYPYYDADLQPWWCLFHGINLHGLYYGGFGPSYYDERLLGADLGPMPVFERLLNGIEELRAGPAKLMLNAERVHDGVAFVYSRPSNHLCALYEQENLPWAPEWEGQATGSPMYIYMQNWEGLACLFSDIGLAYNVIPSQRLDTQPLDTGQYRVLVLPFNLTLTEQAAATIRAFVDAGGTVVADALPGRFDGLARPARPGMLADVFGVAYTGAAPGSGVALGAATTAESTVLGTVAADSAIRLDGGEALGRTEGGTPILIRHSYGKGHAILLNLLARDYQIWRTLANEMPFRDTVAGMLAEGPGIRPAVACDITSRGVKQPHRIQACEFHRYRLGGASYLGVLRVPKLRPDDLIYSADARPKPVWMTLPEKAHVYDVRRRMYRGCTDRLEDVIYPGRAEFYALLPYEVRDIQLTVSAADGAIRLAGAILPGDPEAAPVTHVVHVAVTAPSGRVHRELARNGIAAQGRFEERIFVGYNAEPGAWTVTATDVASGTERAAVVALP
ncbi:MAG: beta-galactosidase trimerization domain-containing protein, partial [Candidatus Hydrogenedentes bacterium]|nr:beta-galactosidase trimerization domain-containing protein [Candidatus Hydrogenedentota bacterium]